MRTICCCASLKSNRPVRLKPEYQPGVLRECDRGSIRAGGARRHNDRVVGAVLEAEDTDDCLCLYLGVGGAGFLEPDGLVRQTPFPVVQAPQSHRLKLQAATQLETRCLSVKRLRSHRVCPTPHERPEPPPRPLSPLCLNQVEQDSSCWFLPGSPNRRCAATTPIHINHLFSEY